MAALHVLTVSRWYPSHDVRFRGAFVADLVAALGQIGVDSTVASWEPALVRGGSPSEPEIARAVGAWAAAVRTTDALNAPHSWGRGVPVARLPEVDDAAHQGWQDRVRAHAALLDPFADGLARRAPIDLVHAHTGVPDGLVAAAAAERLDVPLVVTEHASDAVRSVADDPALAAAYRALLDGRRRLVTVSGTSRARLATALGADIDRIAVIGNVVDTGAFSAVGAGARDPDELLWVGERSDKKGTDVLLAAFALLAADRPGLRLRLIGRSPTPDIEARWRGLAAELGVADRVALEGPAGRPGVAQAMARAAVLVHPSPAETFGVVAAEAGAGGLPVAATPSGGVEDIVGRDGALGTIAASHDPADLARAVEDVLARRTAFDAAAMRRSIEARFSAAEVARQYERVYSELLEAGPSRTPPRAPIAPIAPVADVPPEKADRAPALVVGLQRTLLERRLASLPWQGHPAVTVLTQAARQGASPDSAAGFTLVEADPDAPFRREMARLSGPALMGLPDGVARALRLLVHPHAGFARRRLRERREELRTRELERLVLDAWRQWSAGGEAAWIVALDPVDVLASRAAIEAGARLAPGGLRWLADRLDAAALRGPAPS
jgi:glycosyltransferase involved in cell wall biosynthesis